MAADIARRRYPTKRGFSSIGEEISTTENLPKKGQLEKEDNSLLRRSSITAEVSRTSLVCKGSIFHLLEVEHRFYKS